MRVPLGDSTSSKPSAAFEAGMSFVVERTRRERGMARMRLSFAGGVIGDSRLESVEPTFWQVCGRRVVEESGCIVQVRNRGRAMPELPCRRWCGDAVCVESLQVDELARPSWPREDLYILAPSRSDRSLKRRGCLTHCPAILSKCLDFPVFPMLIHTEKPACKDRGPGAKPEQPPPEIVQPADSHRREPHGGGVLHVSGWPPRSGPPGAGSADAVRVIRRRGHKGFGAWHVHAGVLEPGSWATQMWHNGHA